METRKKIILAGCVLLSLIVGLAAIWSIFSREAGDEPPGTSAPPEESGQSRDPREEARRLLVESATAMEENALSKEDHEALVLSTTAPKNSESTIAVESYRSVVESVTALESSGE